MTFFNGYTYQLPNRSSSQSASHSMDELLVKLASQPICHIDIRLPTRSLKEMHVTPRTVHYQ